MEIIDWNKLLYPYEQVVAELELKLNSISEGFLRVGEYSPIESVSGRVKDVSSIIKKLNRKNIPRDRITEEIEDLAGLRVVCKFVEDIARIVILIRERDGRDLEIVTEKDYITNYKESGYRSYHIIVRYPITTAYGYKELLAEIQIRTLAMNSWATIEHMLKYKYSGKIPLELKQRIIACADAAYKLDSEMSTIRDELIEAQKVIEIKNNLISEILENIQNLYYVANSEHVDQLNKQFYDIFDTGDLEKMYIFNKQLGIIAELYRKQN